MLKKLVSITAAFLTAFSTIPFSASPAGAETTAFPYTIFAASAVEPAVSIQADYGCVNGKIAANGTVQKNASWLNLNGTVTEYAEQEMIYVLRKLNETYFQTESVVLSDTDYSESRTNLAVRNPLKAAGNVSLNGNINLESQIMAAGDIALSGSCLNTTTAVLISEAGNITADMNNFSFSGLIYAPNGEVTIHADNINLNSVVVIAQKVTLNCICLNANHHAGMAALIGTESEEQIDDHHDDPDAGPAFLAMAEYDEQNSAVILQWDQPEGITRFEIRTSDDGDSYQLIASVEDACEYIYPVTEPFEEKYFIVSYTDAEGETVESPAVCVKHTEEGYVIQFGDTDGDGLDDALEALYVTDRNEPDTDGDGLSDSYEVFRTGTDPAVFDSVTEGVSDGEADTDNDGLTNLEELTLGTDPRRADTDGEGLTDGDEVNEYHTDPLLPDTDGDGVDDASEIALGLDPLKDLTFGDPDASHIFPQTIAADSDVFLTVNTEESPYEMSVSLKTNLSAEKHTDASESGYATAVSNDAMLGMCTALTFDEACSVSDVVITYAIKPAFTDNTLGTFADLADMAGIKRLCVFAYDEGLNMLIPVETEYDTENNTISAAVDGSGSYCVMDLEIWLDMLGISPDDFTDEEAPADETADPNAAPRYAAPRIRAAAAAPAPAPAAPAPAYTTYEFNGNLYAIFELNKSWEDCKTYCESLGGHLATITSAEEQAFLNTTVLPHGTKNTYFVGLTRANAFSNWEWVTGEPVTYYNWDSGEPNYDHEHWVHIYRKIKTVGTWNNTRNYVEGTTPYSTYMAGCICEWDTGTPVEYNILVGTNFKKAKLKGALRENGLTDTDGDSLSDWQEINSSYVTVKDDGTVELSTLGELFDEAMINAILNRSYSNDYVRRGMAATIRSKQVLPCVTDPSEADTDGDGYADVSDPFPTQEPEDLEKQYDFMHNEVYSLKAEALANDMYLDYSSSGSPLKVAGFRREDVQKFRFVWCGDGYKIYGLNTTKVLTVAPDSTRFSVYMEEDRDGDEQKWEVLPYNVHGMDSPGIVIRSKVFDYTQNPLGDPIYLSCQNKNRIGALTTKNNFCIWEIDNKPYSKLSTDIKPWICFGSLYMQRHGWIPNTDFTDTDDMSDLQRAFNNYANNKRYRLDGNYVEDTVAHVQMLLHQGDANNFGNMRYADAPMSDVICEVIGTYNAINASRSAKKDDPNAANFLRLAVEFEISGIRKNLLTPIHTDGSFTSDGGWGSWPFKIANCLDSYYIDYEIAETAEELDTLIKDPGIKSGVMAYNFKVAGIHTFAVIYHPSESQIYAYNRWDNWTDPDKKPTISALVGEVTIKPKSWRYYYIGFALH